MMQSRPLSRSVRAALPAALVATLTLGAMCYSSGVTVPPPGDRLALGTWGGDNAGVIVTDSLVHVHVGCTYGDVRGRVPLDPFGRFSVSGSYTLRAYPIAFGPSLPAQFDGRVVASTLTLSIVVNDTVEKRPVLLGPVSVVFGREPRMGPCPICRQPGMRSRRG